jgi:hypothetical protein
VNVDTLASITSRDELGPSLLTWRGASRGSRMVEFSHPDFLTEEAPTGALAEPRGLWLFTEQNAIAWAPAGSGAGFTVADRLWPGLQEQGFVAATAAAATLAVVGVWDDPPHGALAVGQWVGASGLTGVPRALPIGEADAEALAGALRGAPAMYLLRRDGDGARVVPLTPARAPVATLRWPRLDRAPACAGPLDGWFEARARVAEAIEIVGPVPFASALEGPNDYTPREAEYVIRVGLQGERPCVAHWKSAIASRDGVRQHVIAPTATGATWTLTDTQGSRATRHTFACTREQAPD